MTYASFIYMMWIKLEQYKHVLNIVINQFDSPRSQVTGLNLNT